MTVAEAAPSTFDSIVPAPTAAPPAAPPAETQQEAPTSAASFDRHHPFLIGLTGAFGVITAYIAYRAVADVADVLLLIGISLFLAIGFEPVIARLSRRVPRMVAVFIVIAAIAVVLIGFVALALPPIVHEVTALTKAWPKYRQQILSGQGTVGKLAAKAHLDNYLKTSTSAKGGTSSPLNISLVGGVLGAGEIVVSAISGLTIVMVLSLYFMVTLPSVRALWLRFIPQSRRQRGAELTDEAFVRVGGFVLGNILTSVVAGAGTTVWATALGIPYPFLLGMAVALFDLIPIVGSTVGGIIVSLVGLTQGVPIAIATAVFYLVYRFLEDHLLNPQVMRRTVRISAGLSIVATLVGGALLGLLGALVAIPVAATIQVVLEQVTFPSLDRS
jgi:predicted PurR-regulated permease PerM